MNKIRVRFAPSPTGYMHIGNLRSALYAYLFAKKNGGDFILRIEDTDKNRFVKNAIDVIMDTLQWVDIDWEEGVFKKSSAISERLSIIQSKNYPELAEKGGYGPYIQSERLDIYKKFAQELVDNDNAYYCFCSSERLEKMRENQLQNKQAPMYDRTCLKLSKEKIAEKIKNKDPHVIRQKINTEGVTEFDDIIRGKVSIKNELLDDQVLLKSDGYPTYNFANVVDDHLMEITHVMRGEEYISSTPKYTQLYQNFGWNEPKIAHLPLILNPDKTKLSKRQGDVAVEDYIQKGYLKEAIINFVALLGWNPGGGETQEIFSMEELVEKFDLSHVHKAGAVFDIKKLDWINSEWIKKLSINELYARALSFVMEKDFYKQWNMEHKAWNKIEKENYLKKVLSIEQDRLNNLSEVGESNKFFFEDFDYNKELLRWKNMNDDELKNSLEKSKSILENIDNVDWIKDNLEKILMDAAGDKKGNLLWPLRAALTGEKKSPPPYEVAWVLGKNKSSERIDLAIGKILK
jgi:glutamyl-tRNA synthetase